MEKGANRIGMRIGVRAVSAVYAIVAVGPKLPLYVRRADYRGGWSKLQGRMLVMHGTQESDANQICRFRAVFKQNR